MVPHESWIRTLNTRCWASISVHTDTARYTRPWFPAGPRDLICGLIVGDTGDSVEPSSLEIFRKNIVAIIYFANKLYYIFAAAGQHDVRYGADCGGHGCVSPGTLRSRQRETGRPLIPGVGHCRREYPGFHRRGGDPITAVPVARPNTPRSDSDRLVRNVTLHGLDHLLGDPRAKPSIDGVAPPEAVGDLRKE